MVGNGIIRRDATGLALCSAGSGAVDSTAVTPTQTRNAEDCRYIQLVKFQPWKSPRLWQSPSHVWSVHIRLWCSLPEVLHRPTAEALQ